MSFNCNMFIYPYEMKCYTNSEVVLLEIAIIMT